MDTAHTAPQVISNRAQRRWRGYLIFLTAVVVLIGIWFLVARLVRLPLILPDPADVFRRLGPIISSPNFLTTLGATMLRGFAAFAVTAVASTIIGLVAGASRNTEAAFRPVLGIVQATPTIAVILLAEFWFPQGIVPVFVAVLTSFPVVYWAAMHGIRGIDRDLAELAEFYNVPLRRRIAQLYLPSVSPFLISGYGAALGLTWKVIMSAEALAQPRFGIGTQMQSVKSELEIASLFAWTAVAVILSGLNDGVFALISALQRRALGIEMRDQVRVSARGAP